MVVLAEDDDVDPGVASRVGDRVAGLPGRPHEVGVEAGGRDGVARLLEQADELGGGAIGFPSQSAMSSRVPK